MTLTDMKKQEITKLLIRDIKIGIIKRWLDKKDICPYCKSKEIFDMRSELSKRTRDSTCLLACQECEGIFGYYT